jgi:hypothetical protein
MSDWLILALAFLAPGGSPLNLLAGGAVLLALGIILPIIVCNVLSDWIKGK